MPPISAPHRVEAELVIRKMKAGRNGAILLQSRGTDGDPVECVVKLAGAMATEQAGMLPEWTTGAANGKLKRAIEVLKKRRDAVDVWLPKVEAWLTK